MTLFETNDRKREGHQEVKKLLAIDERSEKDELRRLIVKPAEANESVHCNFKKVSNLVDCGEFLSHRRPSRMTSIFFSGV